MRRSVLCVVLVGGLLGGCATTFNSAYAPRETVGFAEKHAPGTIVVSTSQRRLYYLLGGGKWNGPRAGFNPAGWIAWLLGFGIGVLPILNLYPLPAAPVAAFMVGAAVYFVCAKANLLSATVPISVRK